jgi:hypothetical protein
MKQVLAEIRDHDVRDTPFGAIEGTRALAAESARQAFSGFFETGFREY